MRRCPGSCVQRCSQKTAEQMGGLVIIVLCGGNNISFGQLQRLKKQLGLSNVGDNVGPA